MAESQAAVDSMDDSLPRRRSDGEETLPGLALDDAPPPPRKWTWPDRLREALSGQHPWAMDWAEQAVRASPLNGEVLILAALAMLAGRNSARAFVFLKTLQQRFVPSPTNKLLFAVAYAQKGQ